MDGLEIRSEDGEIFTIDEIRNEYIGETAQVEQTKLENLRYSGDR